MIFIRVADAGIKVMLKILLLSLNIKLSERYLITGQRTLLFITLLVILSSFLFLFVLKTNKSEKTFGTYTIVMI